MSLKKGELVALLQLSHFCHVAVGVLCLFLAVLWFGLQYVIVEYLAILTNMFCGFGDCHCRQPHFMSRPI